MSDTNTRRDAFALKVLGMAHEDRIDGSDVAAAMLAVLSILYAKAAAGDVARFEALIQDTVAALWRNADAPSRPIDPGQIVSDDELAAYEALVAAAIRWTKSPKAKVEPSFRLIMAELRRLRAARV